MNHFIISGQVQGLEKLESKSGNQYGRLSLSTIAQRWDGEWVKNNFRITLFRKFFERACRLDKGEWIELTGTIASEMVDGKNGGAWCKMDLMVESMSIQPHDLSPFGKGLDKEIQAREAAVVDAFTEDDIPF